MTTINPYNDDNMTYDQDKKMYVLTKEYITNELGNSFMDDKTLERRLKANSRIIYNFIHKSGNAKNRKIVDFILNETEEGRKFMLELLTTQMEADLETGINSLGNVPRLNVKNGQVLDKEAMAYGYISQFALDLLDTNDSVFGINILYQGIFPPQVYWSLRGK